MAKNRFSIITLEQIFSRKFFFILPVMLFWVFGFTFFAAQVNAATGMNKTINFQGKLVGNNGINVADGSYTVVFSLYTLPSGGANVWTETQNVTTTNGIFQVQLGSVTTLPGSVDFNTDNIYLGIKVGADAEMTPRIQFTAVPYAFNAQRVNGLNVTNESGNPFSSATTFRIADGKTVVISNGLTLAGTDSTTITFQGTDTYVGRGTNDILTNKTIGSTGLTFSGASTDITTGTDEALTFNLNGSGDLIVNSDFDSGVSIGSASNTPAPLSISGGIGSNASLIVNNNNSGDLFVASQAGATKFRVANNGDVVLSAGLYAGGSVGTATQCLLGGATATWGTCGSSAGDHWVLNNGLLFNGNQTLDFAVGGNSSSSAKFRISMGASQPTASVSANTTAAGLVVDNRGTGDLFTASKAGATKFVIDSNGNVGIGKADVSTKLAIRTDLASGYGWTIEDNTGGAQAGAFVSTLTCSGMAGGCGGFGTTTNHPLIFFTGDRTAQMTLRTNGSFGIGTVDPLGALDVRGNNGHTPVASFSGSSAATTLLVDNNGTGNIFSASKSGATKFTIQNSGVLGLDTANYTSCDSLVTDAEGLLTCGLPGSGAPGDDLLAVYTISAPSGTNLTLDFDGTANSQPSSTSGTITFPSNASKMIVEVKGAGGGGGGTGTATAIKNAGGGGEGGYAREYIGSVASTYYIKVGGGGPGAVGNATGGLGSSTCFGTNASDACVGAMLRATGGSGGAGVNSAISAAGGNGGAGSGGDMNTPGQAGFASVAIATTATWSGAGGGSGGAPAVTVAGNGTNGSMGGGGSGAGGIASSATSRNGGSGGNGYVVIYIYKNASSGDSAWMQFSSGVLAPGNLTNDVLFGGNATESAKFAVLNMNPGSGTPTASLSAGIAGGAYLTATGILQTTANQTLTIGGTSTGNILLDPQGQNFVGIGTSTPLAQLDVRTAISTAPSASISANSTYASLVVNNSGNGDLFTASSSGLNRFVIKQNGNIGIGTILPNALLDVNGTASVAGMLNFRNGAGSIQTTQKNTLTLGGTSTGDIQFKPGNSSNSLYLASNSRVGIGTTVPEDILHVSAGGILLDNGFALRQKNSTGTIFNTLYTDGSNLTRLSAPSGGTLYLNPDVNNITFLNYNNTLPVQVGNGSVATNLYVANGTFGVNTVSPLSTLDVRGASDTVAVASVAGKSNSFAAMVVDSRGTGDIFAASSSGLSRFVIKQNGAVGIGTSLPALADKLQVAATNVPIMDLVQIGNSVGQEVTANGINALQVNWRAKPGTNNVNSAARFDIVNSNTVAGGQAQGLRIAGTGPGGTIASDTVGILIDPLLSASTGTTGQNALEIGGNWDNAIYGQSDLRINAAGNIIFATSSATTKLGINTTLPLATFDVRGKSATLPVASIAGSTNFAALVANNFGTGDLFAASSSGVTQFVIKNGGQIGIGTTMPVTNLDIRGLSNASASISAGLAGAIYMAASGSLQTTNNQSLILGGTTTGNILINHLGGNYTGIGTANPLASLDVRGATGLNGGTLPVASVSGRTSYAAMVVNNVGSGDLFTASAGGSTRFRIGQNGSVLFQGSVIAASGSGSRNGGSPALVNALPDQGSMVPNAGFEATMGGLSFADGWIEAGSTSGRMSNDTTTQAKGTSSARATLNNQQAVFFSSCMPLSGVAGSYTLNYYVRGSSATAFPTVRAYLDQYTSKANCQTNTTPTITVPADTTVITNAWTRKGTSTTAVTMAAATTWARVHFFIHAANAVNVNIDGVRVTESTTGQGLDYAENYPADPNNLPEAGDVVALRSVGGIAQVTKAQGYMNANTIGVVSTNPGQTLDDGTMGESKVPVALAGRIPAKVSTTNGEIHIGDYLTSSAVPGVAVKAINAGPVIGQAMEDYVETDKTKVGKVVMFVKNVYYNGFPVFYNSGLTEYGTEPDLQLLGALVSNTQQVSASESALTRLTADKVVAGLAVISPKIVTDTLQAKTIKPAEDLTMELSNDKSFVIKYASSEAGITFKGNGDAYFAGTITADTIRVKQIEITSEAWEQAFKDGGLQTIESRIISQDARITNLESWLASVSALTALTPTPAASPTAALSLLAQMPEEIDEPQDDDLASTSGKTIVDNFRVTGSALVEGMLHVVDFLTTRNLIVDQLATFLGNVVFRGDVLFQGRPTYNSDTAGYAVIKKGSDRVEVKFAREYEVIPLVQATVSVDELSPTPNEDIENLIRRQDALEQRVLGSNARYVVTKRTTKGFIILLAKSAEEDMTFSWLAVAVDKPVVQESGGGSYHHSSDRNEEKAQPITSTYMPTIIPSSIPMPTTFVEDLPDGGKEGGE